MAPLSFLLSLAPLLPHLTPSPLLPPQAPHEALTECLVDGVRIAKELMQSPIPLETYLPEQCYMRKRCGPRRGQRERSVKAKLASKGFT